MNIEPSLDALTEEPDLSTCLVADDHMRLSYIVETSLQVNQRHQFFRWSQGILQTLLPHEILVCLVAGSRKGQLESHYFSATRYFQDAQFREFVDPACGLVVEVSSWWKRNGGPVVLDRSAALVEEVLPTMSKFEANELRNAVIHGVWDTRGEVAGIYLMSRVPVAEGTRRIPLFLEMLVPTIHSTFARTLRAEGPGRPAAPVMNSIVRAREVQVLRLIRAGKTNAEIAQVLELSPWTVKNHLHNILKKLGADNRGHAVASAISMGILDPD
jgi:transcriptional regulator EpsA